MRTLFFLCSLLLLTHCATASEQISSDLLTKGSVSWDGGSFSYKDGRPEITVQKITIRPGSEEITIAVHCHTMPMAAYVAKGSVKVLKPSGETKLFQEGDAFIEVMNAWHKGVIMEETELIVFYAGITDLPLSVKLDENPPLSTACR